MTHQSYDQSPLHDEIFPIALLDLAENFYERRKMHVSDLYKRCNILQTQIIRKDEYINGWQFRELLRCCAGIAFPGTPLSTQLADCIPITVPGGMFGLASFTAKNVQQALEVMVDFSHTVMPAYKFESVNIGKQQHIVMTPLLDFDDVQAHLDESVTGYFLNLRHFTQLCDPPAQIHLTHEPLGEIKDYEELFKAKFLFSQKSTRIIFEKHHLLTPLSTHNQATFNEVYIRLQNASSQSDNQSTIHKVMKILQTRFAQGKNTNMPLLAETMNISERTLARRLHAENSSFVEIKQQVSISYAKLLLESTEQPISKIAHLCGYNSDSNFSRAFKLSTGLTPKQFRAKP